MTTSGKYSIFDIAYPDSDGLSMAESDVTRDYLIYGIEALDSYFQNRPNVYVSGNLFIYYEQGNPKAVVAPDSKNKFGTILRCFSDLEFVKNYQVRSVQGFQCHETLKLELLSA